tara:strand:+ start:3587 stop:3862 length:276 start_codon:yes stop_codon:yes gene_type:complete
MFNNSILLSHVERNRKANVVAGVSYKVRSLTQNDMALEGSFWNTGEGLAKGQRDHRSPDREHPKRFFSEIDGWLSRVTRAYQRQGLNQVSR